VADVFGGLDVISFIRTGVPTFLGKFVVEENGSVKAVSYDEFAASTGMKYLWANDTLYWDQEALSLPAALKRPFFPGGNWASFAPNYATMRQKLRQYYQQTGDLVKAVLNTISDMGGWYKGYNFQWPIHTEPVESPVTDLALDYPTLAWLNPYNLEVLQGQPDGLGKYEVGVALTPSQLSQYPGVLVVMTSNRLTETWHTGQLSRNVPYLRELVPMPFVTISKRLAEQLGVSPGDLVTLYTARGSITLPAFVTDGEAYLTVDGQQVPVVNITWFGGFQGNAPAPAANFIVPDVGDVVTTIQESKAWMGKIAKA
jgi:formate dehydrogenase major subunit